MQPYRATVKSDSGVPAVLGLSERLFRLRPFDPAGQCSGELEQATAQGRIVDLVVGANKLNRLTPPQGIGVERFCGRFGKACGDGRRSHRIHVVEEERHRDVQNAAQIMQAAGSDAIGAALVFLDLLKGQANRLSELFLAQAEHVATQSHARADMNVDRVRLVTLPATRPSGLLLHRHLWSITLAKAADRGDRLHHRTGSTTRLNTKRKRSYTRPVSASGRREGERHSLQRSRIAIGSAPSRRSTTKVLSPTRA